MSAVAVIGASGRTGRGIARELVDRGHRVIGVSRTDPGMDGVEHRPTDVLDARATAAALAGADGVVIALGISENPLSVRWRGARGTADDIRSAGTRNVLHGMRAHHLSRLVVLSSYGVGDSAAGLSPTMRVVMRALLRPQIRDHEVQEEMVRETGLDWTIARPVNLVDGEGRAPVVEDAEMRTVSMAVGRDQVARVLAGWVTGDEHVRRAVALSS